jgi:hypothetical protein
VVTQPVGRIFAEIDRCVSGMSNRTRPRRAPHHRARSRSRRTDGPRSGDRPGAGAADEALDLIFRGLLLEQEIDPTKFGRIWITPVKPES